MMSCTRSLCARLPVLISKRRARFHCRWVDFRAGRVSPNLKTGPPKYSGGGRTGDSRTGGSEGMDRSRGRWPGRPSHPCRSADGLQRALDVLATHGHGWLVLGAGSRLVPSDRGLRVPVLNLSGNLGLWELDLDGAVAGGGANVAQVCRAAARTGMSGIDHLMGTGSSVGGAVQASSHGHLQLAGVLDWVDVGRPADRWNGSDSLTVVPEEVESDSTSTGGWWFEPASNWWVTSVYPHRPRFPCATGIEDNDNPVRPSPFSSIPSARERSRC